MKIYVASSWRNMYQPSIVALLREHGHEVYDFRDPASQFRWEEIDPDYQDWTPRQYIKALDHPLAQFGYNRDYNALCWAEAVVLVQPCGASAHLELGWGIGKGKHGIALLHSSTEAELMYKLMPTNTNLVTDGDELLTVLEFLERGI